MFEGASSASRPHHHPVSTNTIFGYLRLAAEASSQLLLKYEAGLIVAMAYRPQGRVPLT
jgi:hypothetical protein